MERLNLGGHRLKWPRLSFPCNRPTVCNISFRSTSYFEHSGVVIITGYTSIHPKNCVYFAVWKTHKKNCPPQASPGVGCRVHSLNSTPFTIHPKSYTLHPTPYTRNPTPYTRKMLSSAGVAATLHALGFSGRTDGGGSDSSNESLQKWSTFTIQMKV